MEKEEQAAGKGGPAGQEHVIKCKGSAPQWRCKPRSITSVMRSAASRPTLAKNARMGQPRFVMGKEEQSLGEGWASPHQPLWHIMIAFLVSIALNGVLLAVASSIDPTQENLSRAASIANALLKPAGAFTEWLAPGHGGAQIVVLFGSSVVVYAVVAWVAISLPGWWRQRT